MLGSAGVAVEYKIIMKYVEQLHLVLHFPPFKLWTINKLCDKFNLTKYYWMFWFYSQYIYYFQCRNSFFFISFTVSIYIILCILCFVDFSTAGFWTCVRCCFYFVVMEWVYEYESIAYGFIFILLLRLQSFSSVFYIWILQIINKKVWVVVSECDCMCFVLVYVYRTVCTLFMSSFFPSFLEKWNSKLMATFFWKWWKSILALIFFSSAYVIHCNDKTVRNR